MRKENEIPQQGLYRESFEHDNCGIGAIVNIKGQKSHSTVAGALHIVERSQRRERLWCGNVLPSAGRAEEKSGEEDL